MHQMLRRFTATLLAAATVAMPAKAWANNGPKCDRFDQVESNATGGDYVGGLLIYETTGTVSRTTAGSSSTNSTSASAQTGLPGTSVSGTATMSQTNNSGTTTTTTQEPIGYYVMDDGSVYQINCLTGEAHQLSKSKK